MRMKHASYLSEENSAPPQSGKTRKTLFFSDVQSALEAAAPEGSTVIAVGFDNADKLLRLGYRTVERDGDVVIARGGESEFLRARNVADGAKLIFIPTHGFAAAATNAYRANDDIFAVMRIGDAPFAAVFDPAELDGNLASIFGEIISLDLCAFDLAFSCRMRGENPDYDTLERVAALVESTTAKLSGVCKAREQASKILAEAGKAAAEIVADSPSLLHFSGAAQMAEALRMLYLAEDRATHKRGETEMLLSAYVADFYIKNLSGEPLSFPPDNGKRIDSICEYFNADIRRACVYTTPVYPPIKMRLCEYRRDEFRLEQTKLLSQVRRRQNNAWTVFKRLYPDDGYAIRNLIDKPDLGICLALAPDVFNADTLLSFLKQTGKLDSYIV